MENEASRSRSASSEPTAGPRSATTGAGQVWLRSERPRRERVTRERIVDAALALLDEEGAERLTMRRLGQRLGTGSTTLYGHVSTKDDVLDLALDAVYAEVALPAEPSADWRDDIMAFMENWRTALLRHPWSAALLGRPMLGPNMLAREEYLHAVLANAGFTPPKLNDTAYALSNYVIGATLMQASWHSQEAGARKAADDHVQANSDRYPSLARNRSVADTDWGASFAHGLESLLDGLSSHARTDTER
ncbi:TetR/AcrR family transcriptional regulator C-terminal domain-containing protein [Nocardiopsis oceani]